MLSLHQEGNKELMLHGQKGTVGARACYLDGR